MGKLLILDGSAMINKYYFATKADGIFNQKNLPVNALNVFFNKLTYLKEYGYDYIAVCLDHSRTNLDRLKLYPNYKGNRPEKDAELTWQLNYAEKICRKYGIPVFAKDGIEADDFAGSIATAMQDKFEHIDILTIDRDYYQLINDKTDILILERQEENENTPVDHSKPYGTKRITKQDLMNEYGLTPDQIIDWKSIGGDSSDNIPGVTGIGEKTAIKLLKHYKTLNNILIAAKTQDHDVLKAFWKELGITRAKPQTFIDYETQAIMSYQLATINRFIPVPQDFEAYRYQLSKDQLNEIADTFGLTITEQQQVPYNQASITSSSVMTQEEQLPELTEEEEYELPF